MSLYIQDNLKLKVSTPLGPNKLLLSSFRGEEQIAEVVGQEKGSDDDKIIADPIDSRDESPMIF